VSLVEGETIDGRYRLGPVLGRGATGTVHRAHHEGLDRPVALKLLHASGSPQARARFEREARVASALDHPGAVRVFDVGEHEGVAYLAMELVAGEPLRALLEGPLPVAPALSLVAEIAAVLVAAHRLPLVHRDLKPSNVMVERPARLAGARVLDFGLAFLEGREERMTVEGVVAGTPAYLSPEQARGRMDLGPATDVYALGCMIHEMLRGEPPFVGTELEVLTRQLYAPPPPLRVAAALPSALPPLVSAMLAKRPEERPTATEVLRTLSELGTSEREGRDLLEGRSARMVAASGERPRPRADGLEVGVVGSTLDGELIVALAASGIVAFPGTDAPLLFAPGASPERVATLAAEATVVSDAEPGDIERMRALLAAGALEVAPRPLRAEELARRLQRAARRARR
jgi:serine/threonine protein kinase